MALGNRQRQQPGIPQTSNIGSREITFAINLRRVCRIWPLYFAVVAFGLFFYNALLPRLGVPAKLPG